MNKEEYENFMFEEDRKLLSKCLLPEHDELLGTLRSLIPTTGNINELFCNMFLYRLINSHRTTCNSSTQS